VQVVVGLLAAQVVAHDGSLPAARALAGHARQADCRRVHASPSHTGRDKLNHGWREGRLILKINSNKKYPLQSFGRYID
jgi:hypothetical protein